MLTWKWYNIIGVYSKFTLVGNFRYKNECAFIFRHAFDELLNKSEKKGSNVGDEVSSDSKKPKLILSCSFLKNYFEKNKDSYEGCDVTQI